MDQAYAVLRIDDTTLEVTKLGVYTTYIKAADRITSQYDARSEFDSDHMYPIILGSPDHLSRSTPDDLYIEHCLFTKTEIGNLRESHINDSLVMSIAVNNSKK